MSVQMRKEIEQKIVRAVVEAAIANGYMLEVFNGDEDVLENGEDVEQVVTAMFSGDEDTLYFFKDGECHEMVVFVYGNDGYDVIHDYTTTLEQVLQPALELAKKYGA